MAKDKTFMFSKFFIKKCWLHYVLFLIISLFLGHMLNNEKNTDHILIILFSYFLPFGLFFAGLLDFIRNYEKRIFTVVSFITCISAVLTSLILLKTSYYIMHETLIEAVCIFCMGLIWLLHAEARYTKKIEKNTTNDFFTHNF